MTERFIDEWNERMTQEEVDRHKSTAQPPFAGAEHPTPEQLMDTNAHPFRQGDRVEVVSLDPNLPDDARCRVGYRGVIVDDPAHPRWWFYVEPEHPIHVKLFNGWAASFTPEQLQVLGPHRPVWHEHGHGEGADYWHKCELCGQLWPCPEAPSLDPTDGE